MSSVSRFSTFKQFSDAVSNQGGFRNASFHYVTNPSNIGLAAQIGGSGIQIGITGIKPNNEITRFQTDFQKYDPTTQLTNELEQAGIHNRKALDTLYQIINFVSEQASAVGQKTLDVVLSVAGFNTKNPPKTINPEFVQEAGTAFNGKYFTPNIWWSDGGSENLSGTIEHHISRTVKFFNGLSLHGNYSVDYSDEGTREPISINRESKLKQKFQVMNDTCAVAASELEGLEEGDNAIGIVCGTGFNIGIARSYNKENDRFRNLENTESGHLKLNSNRSAEYLRFISDLDSPLVDSEGKVTTALNRFENLANLSPETIFSGSCSKVTRSLKKQIQYLKEFAQHHNDINLVKGISISDDLKAAINAALPQLKNIDLSTITDQALENYAKETSIPNPELSTLVKALFKDYLQRLAIFIGNQIKEYFKSPEQIAKLKAINISGSFLVNSLTNLPKEYKDTFIFFIADQIGMSHKSEDLQQVTSAIHLLGRDQMDGLTDLIKFRAAKARLAA